MGQSAILAGAHLKVYVNGTLLGWCSAVQYNIRTPMRVVNEIDSSEANEIIPTTYAVQVTLSLYRGRSQGGAEGLGLITFGKDLLKQKYCNIDIIDRVTDEIVANFTSCMVTNQQWSAQPKSLVQGTITFDAIAHSNAADSY